MKGPLIGVGVLLVKDGKVLLLRRQGAHGAGSWSLPGGHLEFGETFEACAAREVMEETGLSVGACKFLTYTNDIFEEVDTHYVTMYVVAEYVDGEPKIMEPDKCSEVGWFDFDALPEPLFLAFKHLVDSGFDFSEL